jgi:RNA polymerase sigma factor (sigma-70 family)
MGIFIFYITFFNYFCLDLSQNAPFSHLVIERQKPNPRTRSPPPFSKSSTDLSRKEVKGLKPQDEKQVRQTFDSFCKKVLKYTARELYRKQKKSEMQEVPFSGLSEREFSTLAAVDVYGKVETVFDVQGDAIVVTDGDIAKALRELPDEKREIVLLSYFTGMTDYAIAERMDILRRTVTNRRTSSLRQLKRIMEEQGYERN